MNASCTWKFSFKIKTQYVIVITEVQNVTSVLAIVQPDER